MKEIINIYKKNRATVEGFLIATLELNRFEVVDEESAKQIHNVMPFLELVYMASSAFVQTTDYFYKNSSDSSTKGLAKSYLFEKAKIENNKIFISNPYISSHTGNACLTLVRSVGDGYIIYDINLFKLLAQMKLIELNTPFNRMNTLFYAVIGFSLMLFSAVLVFYAGYKFLISFASSGLEQVEMIFTPIIALTLGLAIFDLSKTILEQEVFYKSKDLEEHIERKALERFLITIIIALSIESLMVVFKIALSDYSKMDNALFLIIGVALLIVSLGIFHFLNAKSHPCKGS